MAAATSGSKQPKDYRCNLCGLIFTSSEQLETHKRMDHSKNSSPPAGVG